jgi:hypothetical protein
MPDRFQPRNQVKCVPQQQGRRGSVGQLHPTLLMLRANHPPPKKKIIIQKQTDGSFWRRYWFNYKTRMLIYKKKD